MRDAGCEMRDFGGREVRTIAYHASRITYQTFDQYSTGIGSNDRQRYQVATERHGAQPAPILVMRASDNGRPRL